MVTRAVRASICGLALSSLLLGGAAFAQSRPFPQHNGYAHGFVPTTVTSNDALASYSAWKTNHLKSDCGNGYYRVDNGAGDGSSFSEGMGYGMVLTAYFGDKTEFDGLWKFVQKNFNTNGLMGWHVTCSGFTTSDGGSGSATDGDTDIGLALVAAIDQWGTAYQQPAINYLKSLKAHDYTTCSSPPGRAMATNGDWDKGCTSENTSYFMPGYYRVFARLTGDTFWSQAADDAVTIWLANANATTGLIANEVNQNGGLGTSNENYVDYNGCRVPWRAVLEYLWHGTAGAKQVTDKITNWANTIGIANLVDGYNTDGTPRGQYKQLNAWVGGWTSGAMSDGQSLVDSFASDFGAIAPDNGGYYGASLRTLYLLMLTGNEWEPGVTAGVVGSEPATPTLDDGAVGGGTDGGASSGGANGGDGGASQGGASGGGVAGEDGGSLNSDGGPNGAVPGTGKSGGCGCGVGRPVDGAAAGLVGLMALMLLRRTGRRTR
jgi:endo-1,4-beta-D-glucanase Y